MLSFGGLLSEIISGGSAGINSANPGLVKIMGGFVFPVGLVMYVPPPLLCLYTEYNAKHTVQQDCIARTRTFDE